MDLGAVDYLIKPISDAALFDSIDNQVNPLKAVATRPVILAIDDSPSILASINQILRDK
jgi:PleD family two-component response regulator